jgi:hypothetical protein
VSIRRDDVAILVPDGRTEIDRNRLYSLPQSFGNNLLSPQWLPLVVFRLEKSYIVSIGPLLYSYWTV